MTIAPARNARSITTRELTRPDPGCCGWPAGWQRIEALVLQQATPVALASRLHGPAHWRAVARVGIELCCHEPAADLGIVALFALLHDSRRLNDGRDPEHGRRAAGLVRTLQQSGVLGLGQERSELLAEACAGHADGQVATDVTIGTCWDADRLNLWRVGNAPDRRLLSTAAARRATIRDWSRQVHAQDWSWQRLERMATDAPLPAQGGL